MFDHYYAMIMAGGGGTRLWPLSRQARPKQLLRLVDEGSLFQIAVNRLNGILPLERIFVVTVADLAQELKAQCPAIPEENFIVEPLPRGTASVWRRQPARQPPLPRARRAPDTRWLARYPRPGPPRTHSTDPLRGGSGRRWTLSV